MDDAKTSPLRPGLWKDSATHSSPRLLASHCLNCGEVFFPKREKNICLNCQQRNLEEIELSSTGTIYSFTTVMQRPPIYYAGPVPFSLAWVELPEGVRLETLITGLAPEEINLGMNVELMIDVLHYDREGNAVMTYKFGPRTREL